MSGVRPESATSVACALHAPRFRGTAWGLLFAVALPIACGGDNLIGPENEPAVTNVADDFQFQVTALDQVTETLTYSWENTGTSASVDYSYRLTGGSVTVYGRDTDGHGVFFLSVECDSVCPRVGSSSSNSSTGASGIWTIEVEFLSASGDVSLRVQKRDP